MALTEQQLSNLVSLFTPTAVSEPLSNCLEKFGHFFSKQDHFKVGISLLKLFQHDHTISTRAEYRMLSIFIFLELYKQEEITKHPFLGLFRRILGKVNSFRTEQPLDSEQAHFPSIFSYNQVIKNGQNSQQPDKFGDGVWRRIEKNLKKF